MPHIPDAPYIREAEIDGMPDVPPVLCPCCGEEVEFFYVEKATGDIIGCDRCVTTEYPY